MDRRTVLRSLGVAAVPALAGCASYDRAKDAFNRKASGGILAESLDATSGVSGGLAGKSSVDRDDSQAALVAKDGGLSWLEPSGEVAAFIEHTDFSRSVMVVIQLVDRVDAEFTVGVVRRIGDGVYRVGLSRRSGTSDDYVVHTLLGRLNFVDEAASKQAKKFSVYYRGSEFRLYNPEAR